jgi:lipoate-protein ligase A
LVDALDKMGVKAEFKPPNDIIINHKKISGSAQARKMNVYIYHSTIILDINEDIITQALRNHKPGYITSIHHECGISFDINDLKNSITRSFQDKFGIKLQSGEFSDFEKNLIQNLIKRKYSKKSWNFKQ